MPAETWTKTTCETGRKVPVPASRMVNGWAAEADLGQVLLDQVELVGLELGRRQQRHVRRDLVRLRVADRPPPADQDGRVRLGYRQRDADPNDSCHPAQPTAGGKNPTLA